MNFKKKYLKYKKKYLLLKNNKMIAGSETLFKKINYKDGSVYEGNLKNGKKHGFGILKNNG